MKKMYMALLLAAALLLGTGITGCELERSGNGKLDGYWHLVQVDSLNGKGAVNYSEQLYFWSIQGKLLMLNSHGFNPSEYFCSFERIGDSLIVSNPAMSDREQGDPAVDDPAVLRPYGINATREGFFVEKLSGSKMILKSAVVRLNFVRF